MAKLISELGINHLGDEAKLHRMIEKAADHNLRSIKFQYRSANADYFHETLEMGSTLVSQQLSTANLGKKSLIAASNRAKRYGMEVGISFFRTQDLHSYCSDYCPDFIKIPSAEAMNFELVSEAQKYGVPVIISTGGMNFSQLTKLASEIKLRPNDCVMYCVANYPASIGAALPTMIAEYRNLFDCQVGYSSHDRDWEINIAFLFAGVDIIERHLCESKNDIGLDISTSCDFNEMKRLDYFCSNDAWLSPAAIRHKLPNQGEVQNLKDLGSGYYYDKDYKKSTKVHAANLQIKSPCRGIRAGSITNFVITRDVTKNSPVIAKDFSRMAHHADADVTRLIAHKVALPIRFHDCSQVLARFPLKNFEFHLSYQEIEAADELKQQILTAISHEHSFSIHLPDYISSNTLIDPFSKNMETKRQSHRILELCVTLAKQLEDFTAKPCPLVGSFSVLNGLSKPDFYRGCQDLFGGILTTNGIRVVPQFLPKKAWYFGGSYELDVFCTVSDKDYLADMPCGICLDTAHCIMAANSEGGDTDHWLTSLLPIASHIHIADAKGSDGEGIPFGEGDVKRMLPKVLSHDSVKVVEQWEGHLYDFSGFSNALEYIQEALDCEHL